MIESGFCAHHELILGFRYETVNGLKVVSYRGARLWKVQKDEFDFYITFCFIDFALH